MRTPFTPLRIATIAVITGLGYTASGQVKIGDNPTVIHPSAVLELESPNKALRITRVSLSSTTDQVTVPSPVTGMVVFNTNPSIASNNVNFPASGVGVYYWDGNGWVFSGVGTLGNNFFSLNGNSNVTDGVNFLGTTNAQALNFRVNNQKAGRLSIPSEGNTTFGALAGDQAVTLVPQSNNTLIGTEAGSGITTGRDNTALGYRALQNVQAGSKNTGVGYRAGGVGVGDSANTFLGYEADVTAPGLGIDSATAIGFGAKVGQSNSVVIGSVVARIGIGNTAPTHKLHVTGTDPLRLQGLQGIASSDSVLVTDANGVVKKVSRASVLSPIRANNGLNRDGDSIQLGGPLTEPTTITTSATNTLSLAGLQAGAAGDSVLTISSTGVIRRNTISNLGGAIRVGNGLTKTGDSIALGGTLTAPTTITQNGNQLNLSGGTVNISDSLYAGRARVNNNLSVGGNTTIAGNTSVGGTLGATGATTLGSTLNVTGNTTVTTLSATALPAGTVNDSVLTISNNVVRRVPSTTLTNVIRASNGLKRDGDSIELGGTLNQATEIATAGNNLSITGTGDLRVQDSIGAGSLGVTNNATIGGNTTIAGTLGATGATTLGSTLTVGGNTTVTGKVTATDSVRGANVRSLGNTRTNTLTVDNNATVGGTLGVTGNTTLTTLAVTNTQQGGATDSVLTIGPGGVVRRNTISNLGGAFRAGNGLTKTGDSISLGGTLTAPTTITQNGNQLNLSGGTVNISDSLYAGRARVNTNLTVGGNTTTGTLNSTGNATVGGTLGVTGATTLANTLNVAGTTTLFTPTGASTDSILTQDPTTGVVRKVAINTTGAITTASNGLTKVGNDVRLGGTLQQTTNINTNSNTLTIAGGGTVNINNPTNIGANTDITGNLRVQGGNSTTLSGTLEVGGTTTLSSLSGTGTRNVVASPTGVLSTLPRPEDSTIARNGLTQMGDTIELGGTLIRPTTITTSAANTIALAGLQAGGATDSVLTIGPGGVVRRNTLSNLGGTIRAGNGLTKTGDSISLGGTLTAPTTIAQAGNQLNLSGGTVNISDSLYAGRARVNTNLTVGGNTTTGTLNAGTSTLGNTTINGTVTAAGLATLNGGALVNGGSTLNGGITATGLPVGTVNDSVLTIQGGVVRRVPRSTVTDVIRANNGLTRDGDSIELGGTLNQATTITQAGNQLNFNGGTVAVSDSFSAGRARVANNLTVGGNTTTNTLNSTGNASVGGTLGVTGATTLASTLNVTGNTTVTTLTATALPTGTVNDSVLTIQGGVVRRVQRSTITDVIRASNGLTRDGDTIELGGTLNQATTITQAGNQLNLSGGTVNISDSLFAGRLRVAGNTSIGGTLGATGATTLGSTLTVGGNTSVTGKVTATDSVRGANIRALGNTQTNTLTVDNNATVGGTLGVTGNTTITSLTATGLPAGTVNDTVVTIQNNIVRRVPRQTITDVIRASNGLTRDGDTIELGGTLNQETTINQANNQLNLSGGTVRISDSLYAGRARVNTNLSVGNNATVGGTLGVTGATTLTGSLTANGTSTFNSSVNMTALATGALTDSVVVQTPATGLLRRISPSTITNVIKANNGLTRVGDTIQLGGALTKPTAITTSVGNDLSINGSGLTNINTQLNTQNVATSGNINVTGAIAALGQVSAGNFFTSGNATITGNTNTGSLTNQGQTLLLNTPVSVDSSLNVLNINPAGLVQQIDPRRFTNVIRANNGLNRDGDSIQLGGPLTEPTTITANGANGLRIAGTGGLSVDTLSVTDTATIARLRVINNASVGGTLGVTGATTLASTLSVGGNTTVTGKVNATDSVVAANIRSFGNTRTSTLTATGLAPSTSGTDSLLNVNNGVVSKVSPSAILNGIKAGNGLTKTAPDSISLGGTLNAPTTIAANGANTLRISGTGGLIADTLTGVDSASIARLNVTGNATVGGTLGVTGNTTVGGALGVTGNTTVTTLTATALPGNGTASDSLLSINGGVVRRVQLSTLLSTIKAGNGLTKTQPDSISLGGTLTAPTTITANGANTLRIAGTGGLSVDTLTVTDTASIARLRVINNASVGGTLGVTGATTTAGITNTGNISTTSLSVSGNTSTSTLTATGLATSTSGTDSLLNVSNGVVSKVSPSAILNQIKAGNGLTKTAPDSISLGGTLQAPTTINAFGNNGLTINGRLTADTLELDTINVTAGILTNRLRATGLATSTDSTLNLLNILPGGQVQQINPARITNVIKASNGLNRDGDTIQLGGTLNEPTTLNTDGTNTLRIVATGVGGASQEANQGFNVLATAASSNIAIASRGRLSIDNGVTVNQARGVSGVTNVAGEVTQTATGGYFNGNVRPGATLAPTATVTGLAADGSAIAGAPSLAATNTLMGARFGAFTTDGVPTNARTIGVQGQAYRSNTNNIGVLGAANTLDAQLSTTINGLPAGMNAGVMAINATNGVNDRAIYSDGQVQLRNLLDTTAVDTVLGMRSNTDGMVRRVSTRSILNQLRVGNGLTKFGTDSIAFGGTLQSTTQINTNGNNFNITGGGSINLSNPTNITGKTTINGDLEVNGGNTDLDGTLTVGGATTLSDLAGTGTRAVVAGPNGLLTTQLVPIMNTSVYTTSATVTPTDQVILVNSASPTTLTLPATQDGRKLIIKNIGTGTVTLAGATVIGDGTTPDQDVVSGEELIIIGVTDPGAAPAYYVISGL